MTTGRWKWLINISELKRQQHSGKSAFSLKELLKPERLTTSGSFSSDDYLSLQAKAGVRQ